MDSLFRKSDRLLANTQTEIIRDKMNEIHWDAQLVTTLDAWILILRQECCVINSKLTHANIFARVSS